ncbi:restriction endonuclease subunit S [Aquincola tertiaricarbonis]|uniref:Restriction endonuclease subunit S n=1 Tax=Aquincola tertiaricarbonis TaxID=391953 RepID=A0ABY4SL85_AQUTE|nr:restriction endonuclease subunit S [Aquincola tertiaricarbonis]URI11924.1 restriction endonuclease subunit S [Aquincola tertiaricarbonis]
MLPEGWRHSTLGAEVQLRSGGTPSKENEKLWGGQFPWVSARDMKVMHLRTTGLGLTDAGRAAASTAPANSVLVLTRGMTLLKDLPVCLLEREMAFNQDIKALVPKGSLDARFLAYQLLARKGEVLDLVDTAGHGTGRLDSELLKKLVISLPPLDEQARIADALRTWDRAISAVDELLANKRNQWQGLLAHCLRVPPANPDASSPDDNGGFPPSVQPGIPNLLPAPAGWRRTALGHHLTEVRRPALLSASDRYRLITVKRSRGGVELREVLTGREIKTPSQFYVREGDFLISKRQIVHGACGIVPAELDGAVVSNEYAVLNSDGQIDLKFLRYLSESRYFQQTCFHSSIGVHVEKMIFKTERWLKWPFNIPPLSEQRRIVEILDLARREVELLEQQVQLLRQEKAALMADLLTGKRRVRLDREGVAA